MRVLVLGASGMLGHKVFQMLFDRFDVYATFRGTGDVRLQYPIYAETAREHRLMGIDALSLGSVMQALEQVKPDAAVNCIGIVKQRDEAKAAIPSIQVNALFPHQLANLCQSSGVRLLHLSSDCVFSGSRGDYTESDIPDPVDLYGRTKLLGELDQPGCLTLRTSIIGWELRHRASLLEWLAAQRGHVIKGYRCAIYTGLSTSVLAELIGDLIETQSDLTGLYQVASQPISKYDLLLRLRDALGWQDIIIEPDDQFHCDRSLIGSRFEAATRWQAPGWEEMIAGLAAEWPTYARWRESA